MQGSKINPPNKEAPLPLEEVLEPDQVLFDAFETAMMIDATEDQSAAPTIKPS